MRERIKRSRDPATAGPGPAIASRVTNSQPPLALAWLSNIDARSAQDNR